MEVKYTYSKMQLESTIEFIATHNKHFIGRYDYIRSRMLHHMETLARQFPKCEWIGSMGYLITADVCSQESIDDDNNVVIFEFSVDPSVSKDKWGEGDYIDSIIEVKPDDKSF